MSKKDELGNDDFFIAMMFNAALSRFRERYDRIPLYWAQVFLYLVETDGKISHRDIAQRLNLSPSAVSRILSALEEKKEGRGAGGEGLGLIENIKSAEDRRLREIKLTPVGRQFWEEIKHEIQYLKN